MVCVCVFHLPVLGVWCGQGSGYTAHLEWYAPPVALEGQRGHGGRARRVRWGEGEGGGRGEDGRAAEARRLGRWRFPADL